MSAVGGPALAAGSAVPAPGRGCSGNRHCPLVGTKAVCSALTQCSVVVYICNNKTEAQTLIPNLTWSFAR